MVCSGTALASVAMRGILRTGAKDGLEIQLGQQVKASILKYLKVCDLRKREQKRQRLEAGRPSRRL